MGFFFVNVPSQFSLNLFFLTISVVCKLDLDYNYNALSDIVQLDGAADNLDLEEEDVPLEENDFLGMINAEALKALQEGGVSSDGNSNSSSSDGEEAEELDQVEDEVWVLFSKHYPPASCSLQVMHCSFIISLPPYLMKKKCCISPNSFSFSILYHDKRVQKKKYTVELVNMIMLKVHIQYFVKRWHMY